MSHSNEIKGKSLEIGAGGKKAIKVRAPIVIGGSVDETNVGAALGAADGVIVSTSLRAREAKGNVLWDAARCGAFMDAARSARPA